MKRLISFIHKLSLLVSLGEKNKKKTTKTQKAICELLMSN